MLQQLRVQNLAIVEEASVAFGDGLNVITGETGAGKSVLIGALDLVLGGRADRTAVRAGAAEARAEALFRLAAPAAADALLTELGLPACDGGELLIRRTVAASGAGRCLVNDSPATVQTLRRLGSLLVDVHGPYDHQSLLQPEFQLELLDAFGRCDAPRAAYAAAYTAWGERRREHDALLADGTDVAAEIDRLQFVVDEIGAARLTAADGDDLAQEHAEAANAEAILQTGSAVAAALAEGEGAAFDALVAAQQRLAELARLLPEAEAWRAEAQQAATAVQELARTVADRLRRIEADPGRLRQLEERMALVQRLRRKHGGSVEDVLARLAQSEARLGELRARGERLAALAAAVEAARAAVGRAAADLSAARRAASRRLARAITTELHDLGFARAGFGVDLAAAEPRASGADEVSFGFGPNPGEPMRPLRAIASSGEIARVMLAVQAVLARHDRIPVLVFDEVDANIGGEVGNAVGAKLRTVAASHQVICITHLPQVAVFGSHHAVVSKTVAGGRTVTRIADVDGPARAAEIARMLGGQHLTAVTLDHARAMLAAVAARD